MEPCIHETPTLFGRDLDRKAFDCELQRLLRHLPEILISAHQRSKERIFELLSSPVGIEGNRVGSHLFARRSHCTDINHCPIHIEHNSFYEQSRHRAVSRESSPGSALLRLSSFEELDVT